VGVDSNRGAKRAREARAALGLGEDALPCLLSAIEEAGSRVIVAELPDSVAGACFRGEVLWVNGAQQVTRQRFTLAHELGHAWCRHDGTLEPDTVATLSGKTSNPYEIQANAFAAEFLIPRAGFHIEPQPTLEDVVATAARYGVSAIVIVYRLRQLKLATEERIARLQQEVEAGLHVYIDHAPLEDRLAELQALPYLSPALEGSLLAAALRGDAAVGEDVARAIERITRPDRL
jgi:hypothetical protein